METTIKIQLYIFLTSIYGGLISGLAYDIYRVNRLYFKPRKIVTILEDLLFWIGISFIFFYIINKSNWGSMRGYIFIGFFLGGFIYLKILSKILFPLWVKLFNGIITIINNILKVIKLPFRQIKSLLSPKMKRINRIRKIPREAIGEIKRYKKIISNKK
ncbi:putative Spore cortex biosynthesis protein YabQ [[Clostridium] ultunense Esp]|uniref:Putative Spore cortex biosynthesis protein YabQ n=1 Tax=[Clostridium] ultunense Esp TaxID=1288971 RepID=M1ZLJ9_9FIRM|nr:spore cortex biosynthesis protein YabQ [Schnuerera ultunensis]CCQ97332.1 putative Spore cortex biosynthesis protein YabQ [[Clostridium] ultunense Esp]SHD78392.1 putative Spore cortex biosynthesis protein YabQ [[Clostridium] ultunense Esp]